MTYHSQVALRVRAEKEKHPELFCRDKQCLWRVFRSMGQVTPCPKHQQNHGHLTKVVNE